MNGRIAYIGVGQMGAGMAARLIDRGRDLVGYDISPASRAAAAARGIPVAASLAEALAGAAVIMTSVPDPKAARAAWLGEDGILAHAAPGALAFEFSSIDQQTMVDIGQAASARGLGVIDCPVSGGPNEAAAGKLTLMVGASDADYERALPLLLDLGEAPQRTGGVGTAKVVKLVNNVMSMGNVLIAAEAFALGTAAGIDPQTLFDVLSQSGGRSHHFLKRWPNALKGNWEPGFKMELGEKDVALALDMARSLGRPMPASALVRELMGMALATGYRGKDFVALLHMYQSMEPPKESAQ